MPTSPIIRPLVKSVRFFTSKPPPVIAKKWNPEDTMVAFKLKSNRQLGWMWVLYNLARHKKLVQIACSVTRRAIKKPTLLSSPVVKLVKNQYYPLFIAGEDLPKCMDLVSVLRDMGVRVVLDESVEEANDVEVWEKNKQKKLDIIRRSGKGMKDLNVVGRFAFKLTAVTEGSLFERMTMILVNEQPEDGDPRPFMLPSDQKLFEDMMERTCQICDVAVTNNMSLLLDAEQHHRQPAINFSARLLFEMFNKEKGTIHSTYQMYLKDSRSWLDFDKKFCQDRDLVFGAKVVRGAYLEFERAKAIREGTPNPIFPNKGATDGNYNAAISRLIEGVARDEKISLVIAGHNRESIRMGTDLIDEMGLDRRDERIVFGQLFGMSDYLTLTLADAEYNVFKLLPFGPFEDVMPYLFRRLEENQDVLNGNALEKQLLVKEMVRRARCQWKKGSELSTHI